MTSSLSFLRRGFLRIAFASCLGFGAFAACAEADPNPLLPVCPEGWDYCHGGCAERGTCPEG